MTGHAHFDAADTRLSKLDHTKYGTGFDVYLLDHKGNVVAGPAYLAMVPGGGTDSPRGARARARAGAARAATPPRQSPACSGTTPSSWPPSATTTPPAAGSA